MEKYFSSIESTVTECIRLAVLPPSLDGLDWIRRVEDNYARCGNDGIIYHAFDLYPFPTFRFNH